MKANLSRLLALALPAVLALTSSCSERRVAPTPSPSPAPTPIRPAPMPQVDWREAPITPGDWTWSMSGGQSVATFANGVLQIRCNRAGGAVILDRPGTASGPVPVTIFTSSVTRTLSGTAVTSPAPVIRVSLAARDPLLDAMAFSRGRFALDVAGLPTLYVPSWPEVSRVIEDCR